MDPRTRARAHADGPRPGRVHARTGSILPTSFWRAGWLKLAQDLLLFVGPAALRVLLSWLQNSDATATPGYVAAVVLLVAPILASLCGQHYLNYVYDGSLHVRALPAGPRARPRPAPLRSPIHA